MDANHRLHASRTPKQFRQQRHLMNGVLKEGRHQLLASWRHFVRRWGSVPRAPVLRMRETIAQALSALTVCFSRVPLNLSSLRRRLQVWRYVGSLAESRELAIQAHGAQAQVRCTLAAPHLKIWEFPKIRGALKWTLNSRALITRTPTKGPPNLQKQPYYRF